eukprot:COSAG06_NODE_8474_length_2159_cov_2.179612_3_plen_97_part_00
MERGCLAADGCRYHTAMWQFAIGCVHARLASAATRRRFTSLPDVTMHRERAEQVRIFVSQRSCACLSRLYQAHAMLTPTVPACLLAPGSSAAVSRV